MNKYLKYIKPKASGFTFSEGMKCAMWDTKAINSIDWSNVNLTNLDYMFANMIKEDNTWSALNMTEEEFNYALLKYIIAKYNISIDLPDEINEDWLENHAEDLDEAMDLFQEDTESIQDFILSIISTIDLSKLDTKNVTSTNYCFQDRASNLNLSGWNILGNMAITFCPVLNLSNTVFYNTEKLFNRNALVSEINLKGADFSNVPNNIGDMPRNLDIPDSVTTIIGPCKGIKFRIQVDNDSHLSLESLQVLFEGLADINDLDNIEYDKLYIKYKYLDIPEEVLTQAAAKGWTIIKQTYD